MPRIDDAVRDCALYLYPSREDAERGERAGGSGFLIGLPSGHREGAWYLYAVTNSHVIREGRSPIIRLNNQAGSKEVLDVPLDQWMHHPDGDDIAILPLWLRPDHFAFQFTSRRMFLTKAIIEEHNLGPGDDVVMVGRFVTQEGRQRNWPALRFGNISMMPWEPIRHPRGYDQEAFLVETRSVSGFSGSPVFAFILPLSKRPRDKRLSRGGGPWLMGIDFGHIPLYEPVLEKDGTPVIDGWKVETNSGMSGVIPIWKLEEWLDSEELVTMRDEAEARVNDRGVG